MSKLSKNKTNSKHQKSTIKSSLTKNASKISPSLRRSVLSNPNSETSRNTIKKVVQFMVSTAQLQRKLEIIKQTLSQVPVFTPASLFHRFDADRKGYILEKDVEDFLKENEIKFKGSQLKTLFGRIDTNQSETISLIEFQTFILPNQDPKLRYETIRRPVVIPKPRQKLSRQVQHLTVKFFTQIIKQYSKLSDINSILKSSYDFDPKKIFELLSGGTGYITGQTIQQFMEDNGAELSVQEIGCLVKTLDKKGTAKINQQDFQFFLATMGLKKTHQIFDELSPIPALKDFSTDYLKNLSKARQRSLKQRYKDNKSYIKVPQSQNESRIHFNKSTISNESRRQKF